MAFSIWLHASALETMLHLLARTTYLARGYFVETYNYNDYKEAGIDVEFVQDNQSASKKGVLRGLHFQIL